MPPAPLRPMLASVAERVPTGPEWVHEVKWDGMRVLADVRDGALVLTSRTGRDVTSSYPELGALAGAYDDLLLDGEVVAMEAGHPSFHALADRMHVSDARKAAQLATTRPVTYLVFDLLRLFGQDLTTQKWTARRRLLESLDLTGRNWQVPEVHADGEVLLDVTRERGLEGVVSKRRDAAYTPGRRSPHWRKKAHKATLSVVVGGWRVETGSTDRLGALLVGRPDGGGGWAYAGRVGSGLAGRAAAPVAVALAVIPRPDSPFSTPVPAIDAGGARWVQPRLVVEVRALEVTPDGRLRQPAYLGIRADLEPSDVLETTHG